MIGIIGVGGAGGNIADEAMKYGFNACAINFSQKDLNALEYVKNKLRIPGSEGVGKNRDIAIKLFQTHYSKVTDFIEENFSSEKVVIVTFATGGGSGSGISPILLEVLVQLFHDKVFIAMPILPDSNEAITNQINTLQVIEELSSQDVAIIPLDNQQIKKNMESGGKSEIFSHINEEAIKKIHLIYSYTQQQSKNGNFDEKDFLTVLTTKGVCVIGETEITCVDDTVNLSGDTIPNGVWKSWDDSIFAPINYNKVVRAGVVFDGEGELTRQLNMQNIFKKFYHGMPIDLFEGYYSNELSNKIITIISGLSLPTKRIAEIEQLISANEEKIISITEDEIGYKAKSTNVLDKIRKPKVVSEKKNSTSLVFSKYLNR